MTPSRLASLIFVLALIANPAKGLPPFEFKFKPQQVLTYETTQETQVSAESSEGKSLTSSSVKQLKQWTCTSVDSLGVATLELTILKLQIENTSPDGETIKFDSSNLRSSHADLVKQLSEVLSKPILRVQMASNGQVKESQNLGSQKGVLRELPFLITISDDLPKKGIKWDRDYAVTLEPPLGSGQAYKCVQHLEMTDVNDREITVSVTSELSDAPKSMEDRLTLVEQLPRVNIILDHQRGVLRQAQLVVDQRIENFSGKGSVYTVKGRFEEKLVEGLAGRESGLKK